MNNNYIYEYVKSEKNEHKNPLSLFRFGFFFWGSIFKRLSCLIIWCTLVGTKCVHKEAKILLWGGRGGGAYITCFKIKCNIVDGYRGARWRVP